MKDFFRRKKRSQVFIVQDDGYLGRLHSEKKINALEEAFGNYSRDKTVHGRHFLGSTVPQKRLYVGLFIFSAMCLAFVGRSAQLQIVRGEHYSALAEENRYHTEFIISPRGMISDRTGKMLAHNIPSFLLAMNVSEIPDNENKRNEIFEKIVELTGLQRTDIDLAITQYSKTPYSYVPITKDLSYDVAMRLAVETAALPGFELQSSAQREYESSSRSLSHVLGYTGKMNAQDLEEHKDEYYRPVDEIGKSGLEYSAEKLLRGQPGRLVAEVNAKGKRLSVVEKVDPIPGAHLTLSIDLSFQKFIETRLAKMLKMRGVSRGSVVAIDPQTGGVRALVSLPAYDNNDFAKGIDSETYQKLLDNENKPLFSRAVSGEFPSGSTFKPFVAYAALAEGIVNENTSFLSTGGLRINQWYFPDWKAGGHGITNVRKAISESVNTYFYIISGGFDNITGLGVDRITEYASRFGFGQPTGISLPSEADGFLPSKEWKQEVKSEQWYVGDTYHLGIGQGDFLTSPLQMAVATSIIANGGKTFVPHIIEGVDGTTQTEEIQTDFTPMNQLDERSLNIVRQAMRATVTEGSARSLSLLPYAVAGKTGTAQTPGNRPYHSWFTGFGPYNNPDITLVVLIEEGGESNDAAVPLAREIFSWWFLYGN